MHIMLMREFYLGILTAVNTLSIRPKKYCPFIREPGNENFDEVRKLIKS